MTTLVVGARGGIGFATLKLLRSAGWTVSGCDLADGTDASDPAAMGSFLTHAGITELRHVAVLAGVAGVGGIEKTDMIEWHAVLRANLDTAFATIKACLPALRASRQPASVVLMSSVNGRTGGNELSGPAYAVAKAGIIALTQHLARALAPEVRVNAVAPGPVETPMLRRLADRSVDDLVRAMPLGRLIDPHEVAEAIFFLLDERSRSMTGTVLDINGGLWMG